MRIGFTRIGAAHTVDELTGCDSSEMSTQAKGLVNPLLDHLGLTFHLPRHSHHLDRPRHPRHPHHPHSMQSYCKGWVV
jgi:hypothetical protein